MASVDTVTKVVCATDAEWNTFLTYAGTLPVGSETIVSDAASRTYTVTLTSSWTCFADRMERV